MKSWLLVFVLTLVLVAGCPLTGPDPARLQVNDELRAACASLTDEEIAELLLEAEAWRLASGSYSIATGSGTTSCDKLDCIICWFACLDQVYGR